MINFERHVLENGLRVFLAPMHETKAVTVLFLMNVGSRYETAEQNGLSHFLEHMFFKGTGMRPTTLDISQELDTLGAEYNAFTGEEYTGYYVSTASEHFPIAFDVVTDMLYESKFETEEIEKEKGVIVEEIKMYHDSPTSYLNQIAKLLVYGDTPLGRDIAGTPETVRKFKRDDFVNYRNKYYGPRNTILVIAGNPGTHDWLTTVDGMLSHIPKGEPKQFEHPAKPSDTPPVAIGHKPIKQVHLNLMHYAFGHKDPRVPAMSVLSNILGGTMSSRLFVEVRERRGLAYYVRSALDTFHDIGTFDCVAGVDPDKLEEALRLIVTEMDKLKTEPVGELALARAKQNIKGRMSLRLEDSHSIARYIASEELEMGEVIQPEEYLARIEKVTENDIMKLAKEILRPENRQLAVVGPLDDEKIEPLTDIILERKENK